MKYVQLILLFIFFIGEFQSQTVQSSCTATDSIKQIYRDDADRITLQRFYQLNYSYQDSIKIPAAYSDTLLRALLAVYNATTLPARNAVVSVYNIHTKNDPSLKTLNVFADSTLPWMQQLKQNTIPTGNLQIDNLLASYSLTVQYYYNFFGWFNYHRVSLISAENLNLLPLVNTFTALPNVTTAELPLVIGDGNNITASVTPNYVDLIYKLGWGDCPAGCIYSHSWVFRVYYDCKVESLGDFGYPIPVLPNPAISIVGSRCTNSVITVNVSNATEYYVNNQPVSGPQFTLSSAVPATISIAVYNSSVFPIITKAATATIVITDCNKNPTSINTEENSNSISVVPNPANGFFAIYGCNKAIDEDKIEITLYNFIGQIVIKEKVENKTNAPILIPTAALQAGVYLLSINLDDKPMLTKRVLITH